MLGKGACYWALVGVLIISELLAGAYSLSIAGYYLGRVALIRGHITWVLLWEHIIGVMCGVTYYSYLFGGHITEKLFGGGGAYYRDIAGG